MRSSGDGLIVLTIFALLGVAQLDASAQAAPVSPATTPNRITQAIDNTRLVTLRGNTHPLARPEFDQGPVSVDLALDHIVLLLKRSPAQDSALNQLLVEQQQVSSPNYHHWVTPEEFGRRFGPSDHDIEVITAWLESQGLEVAGASHGRTVIEFSGTAAQVENAFHTPIHKFLVNGEEHWANAKDPQIPAALAPVVTGVARLHNFKLKPQVRIAKQGIPYVPGPQPGSSVPEFTASDGSHGLAPADYATIYNINPLYAAGFNGTGATIAVVAQSNIKASDVTSFRSVFGLPSNPPKIMVVPGSKDPGLVKGDETESLLDVSWAGAVAPNATIELIVSGDVDTSAQYIIDNNLADVMTESYGDCENHYAQSSADNIQAMAQQAAAEGITYTVSTGDSGSAGCDDPNSEKTAVGPFSVNIIAATAYTVAVGGTEFNENGNNAAYWSAQNGSTFGSALSYIPEDVWNESCTVAQCGSANAGIWATGGGASVFFPKPAWQTGVTGIPNDGARDVPDISLSAASHDYYLLCEDGSCTANSKGQFTFDGVSGTSASAPSFAGVIALVKQRTGARQGQADNVLYQLAATENVAQCNASSSSVPPTGACIFNDVTVGNNAVPGEAGYGTGSAKYPSTPGYDLATGLGSVNVANLVNEWGGASSVSGAASLSPGSLSFSSQRAATASGVRSITLSNTGTTPLNIRLIYLTGANPSDFLQSNNCGASLAAGASCTVSVTFAPTGTGSRSGSLSFSDSAPGGTQSVSLTGTGTENSQAPFGGAQSGDVSIIGDFDGDGQLDYATWRPSNGMWFVYESSNPGTLVQEQWGAPGDIPVAADYDGDGKTDFAVWRPSAGMWFVIPSRSRSPYAQQWGLPGDIPVSGDFDGDGKADLTVWRPSNQTWYSVLSGTGAPSSTQWGLPGDVPLAGDFDGSGHQEIAVWRPGTGSWYVRSAKTSGAVIVKQWGLPGDVPVPADYDGDGVTDFAVWRPSNQNWYVVPSGNPGAPYMGQYGLPTNVLATKLSVGSLGPAFCVRVPGDFDGDGKTDFAVWQPSTGNWFVIPSSNPGNPLSQPSWGQPGDVPVAGDFDGDGKADFAVWRPSTGQWWIIPSSNPNAPYVRAWGLPGDIPIVGDFDGDGKSDLAVWRPSNGTWYIVLSGSGALYSPQWGLPGDVPVAADFDGDGKTDVAVWRPSNGTWYVIPSDGSAPYMQQWGLFGDAPVAGDFNGSGKADFTVWRGATQSYYTILNSQSDGGQMPFGLTGNTEIYRQPR